MAEADYFNLCGNCGAARPWSEFTLLQVDFDTGELRPARAGEMDPIVVCPKCGWHHVDNDSGPGLWDGSELEVTRQRAELLCDPIWAEAWADVEVDLLLAAATAARERYYACPRWRLATRRRLQEDWLLRCAELATAEHARLRMRR